VKAVRERALVAKKDCGRPYHEPLPDFSAFTGIPIVPPTWALGTASGEIGWLGLMLISSFASVASAVAVSGFFNPNGNTDVAVCVDELLFTSDFLMRLIEAPVVRLRTWKVLVWSKTRRAEGEGRMLNTASTIRRKLIDIDENVVKVIL
jgi:hypothetical protein